MKKKTIITISIISVLVLSLAVYVVLNWDRGSFSPELLKEQPPLIVAGDKLYKYDFSTENITQLANVKFKNISYNKDKTKIAGIASEVEGKTEAANFLVEYNTQTNEATKLFSTDELEKMSGVAEKSLHYSFENAKYYKDGFSLLCKNYVEYDDRLVLLQQNKDTQQWEIHTVFSFSKDIEEEDKFIFDYLIDDENNTAYILTTNGLIKYNLETKEIKQFEDIYESEMTISNDGKSIFFIGSGITKYDIATESFEEIYSHDYSLLSVTMYQSGVFSPDGRFIARIKESDTMQTHVKDLEFMLDSDSLDAGSMLDSMDISICVFDLEKGKETTIDFMELPYSSSIAW